MAVQNLILSIRFCTKVCKKENEQKILIAFFSSVISLRLSPSSDLRSSNEMLLTFSAFLSYIQKAKIFMTIEIIAYPSSADVKANIQKGHFQRSESLFT